MILGLLRRWMSPCRQIKFVQWKMTWNCWFVFVAIISVLPHCLTIRSLRSTGMKSPQLHRGNYFVMQYRLYPDDRFPGLGILSKPVGLVLNYVGDLLRIQGPYSVSTLENLKSLLIENTDDCQPNGLNATPEQRQSIKKLAETLESFNPISNPALSPSMNGFWRMLYTDFEPAAASSGKLGPFVGEVFQDLDMSQGKIKNILKIKFPPIEGALVANASIRDKKTWQVEFDYVANSLAGIRLPVKYFTPGKEIRLWEITYLDKELRILRARRPEATPSEAFIFILRRDEGSRPTEEKYKK